VKPSYLIPLVSGLSLAVAAGACAPDDEVAAEPVCDLVRYADHDGDRKGDPSTGTTACAPAPGWVDNADDCDDTNPYVNADEKEICDGLDNDCRATTREETLCQQQGCTPVVNATTGTSYLFCATTGEAPDFFVGGICNQHGYRAGQIEDKTENDYLVQQLRQLAALDRHKVVRLGGSYADTVWRWADGRQFWPDPTAGNAAPYTNWLSAPPADPQSHVCLALDTAGEPGWRPSACGRPTAVLCERSNTEIAAGPPIERCEIHYADLDGDGQGDPLAWTTACQPSPGWVSNDDDCNDQDPQILRYRDRDGDGLGDPATATATCDLGPGWVANFDDCDDTALPILHFRDSDGDGEGDPSISTTACDPGPFWVTNSDDCADGDKLINTSATEICDGLDNDCNAETVETCPTGCVPRIANTGKRYLFCKTPQSWHSARTVCRAEGVGVDLAIIGDQAENTYLANTASGLGSGDGGWWIGAADISEEDEDGQWRWVGGTPFWQGAADGHSVENRYHNWASSEPNDDSGDEDCGELNEAGRNDAGRWNDAACTAVRRFICER
jgi:hypothetical protein